jgi:hypothetical protein
MGLNRHQTTQHEFRRGQQQLHDMMLLFCTINNSEVTPKKGVP